MTLEEFVAQVEELIQQVAPPGEAKVIIEFPRKRLDDAEIVVIGTKRKRVPQRRV